MPSVGVTPHCPDKMCPELLVCFLLTLSWGPLNLPGKSLWWGSRASLWKRRAELLGPSTCDPCCWTPGQAMKTCSSHSKAAWYDTSQRFDVQGRGILRADLLLLCWVMQAVGGLLQQTPRRPCVKRRDATSGKTRGGLP